MTDSMTRTQATGSLESSARRWVLSPHRSLGKTGFVVLMSFLACVSFVTSVVFVAMGAWPVAGFFGLDVLLIWLAFKLNYRSGRGREIIDLDPNRLALTRIAPSGRKVGFSFNSYWVRVKLDEHVDGRTRLAFRLHQQEVPFAGFLNDDERRGLATDISVALADMRAALN